ncbi:MAG: peptidylprolyl isomerase [Candidatus Krumholzibacteriota bacterium]|nr:peptidylprolyl isomerase [Candidatus Krumholzibacteriota bacterium]
MLKQLRENTKTILWIVVVAFVVSIFGIWGMNIRSGDQRQEVASDIVGKVDGIEISRRLYSNKYQEIYNQIKMQRGEEFEMSVTDQHMLLEQTWENVIQEILLNREIDRLGITITENELVSFLRRTPHPQLRETFVDENGDFDYQAYLQALSDPQADWTELEKWGMSVLPSMKLETYLVSQIHVPEKDILERFNEQNREVTARYITVPFGPDDPAYEPAENEIKSYYEKHKEDYLEPEKRTVRLIELKKEPTDLDEEDVRTQLEEIRDEIIGGEDFAELARIHSEDYVSAQKGGDLGFFGKTGLDSIFTETAFNLKIGEISEPVRTSFGYHIIKAEEKKTEDGKEQVKASHILMRVEPGYETVDSLSTLLQEINEAIREKGFEEGAKSLGLETKDPAPFTRGFFIKDHGYLPRVVNFAFTHKIGIISKAIEADESIYYVKVLKEIPERTKTIDEVREQVIENVRREHRKENARKIAETIRKEAVTSGDLEAVAHSRELEFSETAPFKIDGNLPGIGTGTGFSTACHMLPVDSFSVPVQGDEVWYIIRVISVSSPDMNEFASQRQTILGELIQEKTSEFLAGWYRDLRENAKIEDMREMTLN